MPRAAFVADLQKAIAGVSIVGISNVQQGNDDGEFTFKCDAEGAQISVSAFVQDVSDYPSSHTFMVYTEDGSKSVGDLLTELNASAAGKTILQLLELVSRRLEMIDGDGDEQMLDSQGFDGEDDYDQYEDDDDDVEHYFPDEEDMMPEPIASARLGDATSGVDGYTNSTLPFRQRLRADLRAAKAGGFRVGVLGGLLDAHSCYVTLSCRISKLGISAEAMQAWHINPSEYLVVIFNFPCGYKNMDDFRSYDDATARRYFGVRIGICSTYKPSMQEAVRAFTVLSKEDEKRQEQSNHADSPTEGTTRQGFRISFISRPLNELVQERFSNLIRFRYQGMPWGGAEEHFNDFRAHDISRARDVGIHPTYYDEEKVSTVYPKLVTADHITESKGLEHSLPLVGMQFVLRHFVRCTEFCLICFSKMPDDLQALKPYVCENPLCLYQYMSLGFGPSIEHEILTQPSVVDLLVSFCYTRAHHGHLKDFPTGLSIMVPPLKAYEDDYDPHRTLHIGYQYPRGTQASEPQPEETDEPVKPAMRFNEATRELLFPDWREKCPFRTGDWIVIRNVKGDLKGKARHCRVVETTYWPTVRVGASVFPNVPDKEVHAQGLERHPAATQPAATSAQSTEVGTPIDEFRDATFYVYDRNFDDLGDSEKRQAIYAMLDLLPTISEMKRYLERKAQAPLSSWVTRMPPAALSILRWIIASNRACIMQVADEDSDGEGSGVAAEDRVCGMPGWRQFRFAMGAPDKELRFLHAVKETSDRLKLKYPTLFAWHGSALRNWHSIIREGLKFDTVVNGRAFGNGVYHSQDLQTSLGYSAARYSVGSGQWNSSELKVSQAVALVEIVNAPQEYVSNAPHLVVNQLDWIQTRYLFVMSQEDSTHHQAGYATGAAASGTTEAMPKDFIQQDPNRTANNSLRKAIIIPSSAIAGSRRNGRVQSTAKQAPAKRQKTSRGSSSLVPIVIDGEDDDNASVATLDEDKVIFEDEEETLTPPTGALSKGKWGSLVGKLAGSKPTSKGLTDFVPGSLDYSKLPMMQEPAFANPGTTKRLMKDFQMLIKEQEKVPIQELGWYIDPERMENMYQWIVELHSFDSELPLAKDMKAKGVTSIVLELRFGGEYPMSPPFIRVIQPRFLSFQQGGGGHVTAGGAMCMELLTNDGWSAVSSIESVLVQVRAAITSVDPRSARLEAGRGHGAAASQYGVGEAIEAYIRACNMHGWTVPKGFRGMALGGAPVEVEAEGETEEDGLGKKRKHAY